MIGLGSNRLTVCRRGGMSVTQAGRGGMEWLAGGRMPSWASPYSAQATAALKAQFPTQWPTIRDYGFAHPEDVPAIEQYLLHPNYAGVTPISCYGSGNWTNLNGGENYKKIFDGNTGTKGFGNIPMGCAWTYGDPVMMIGHTITTANDSVGRDPKNYIISGSVDGTEWEQIVEIVDADLPSARFTAKSFDLPEPKGIYKYFKIDFKSAKSGSGCQLSELKIY